MVDQNHSVEDLLPADVAKGITEGKYLLVDVREPNEVAAEAYPDAAVVPLSTFDPASIPDPKGKAGRVRLPLRQALGHGFTRRAGGGAAL